MVFSVDNPLGLTEELAAIQSEFLSGAIAAALSNPIYGTTIHHFKAVHAEPANFTEGYPEYLASDPGIYESGVKYEPNPGNPLKGVFCRARVLPNQIVGGINYQAQMTIYLPQNPGDVYILDGKYPKRQDMFMVNNIRYYATGPSLPCQAGDLIAAWQIDVNRERYPVTNEIYG